MLEHEHFQDFLMVWGSKVLDVGSDCCPGESMVSGLPFRYYIGPSSPV